MTNDTTGGVSKRSLLLLGGLAALALNRDTRRALVGGTRNVLSGAGTALQDQVRPALAYAAEQAQELAQEAAKRSAATLDTLREEAPVRAQTLLSGALSTASDLAHTAQERAMSLRDDAQPLVEEQSKKARKALKAAQQRALALRDDAQPLIAEQSKKARKALKAAQKGAGKVVDDRVMPALSQAQETGLDWLTEAQDRVQDVFGEGLDTVEGKKLQMERHLSRARRSAEKELRAARKNWKGKKLDRAIARKVAPLQKELGRELKVLQQQARRARRDDRRAGGGLGSSLTTLAVVGGSAAVLARNPGIRQNIIDAIDTVSPEAAQALHRVGRSIRSVVGDLWIERLADDAHAADTTFRPTTPPDTAPLSEVVSVKTDDELKDTKEN